jgi:gluconolactonase
MRIMRCAGLWFFSIVSLAFGQHFSKVQIEKVAARLKFAEGPVWSRENFLLFSDVPANQILKFTPGIGVSVFRQPSEGANGNAFDAKGRLYTCESRSRRVTRTERNGAIEVLAERWQGKRLNAPDDIVVSRSGHVYFTDPAFGNQADTRELDFYGVYHITPKGELRLIARPVGRPNGITLSPDGRTLYVANSDDRAVYAYTVARDGSVSGEREFVKIPEGVPDGIRCDEKGSLYVAAKYVYAFSPSGQLLDKLELGETPSNLAFGDPDFMTLYITARTSVYRVRLDVKGAVHY